MPNISTRPESHISFDILSRNYYNYIFGLVVKFGLPVKNSAFRFSIFSDSEQCCQKVSTAVPQIYPRLPQIFPQTKKPLKTGGKRLVMDVIVFKMLKVVR